MASARPGSADSRFSRSFSGRVLEESNPSLGQRVRSSFAKRPRRHSESSTIAGTRSALHARSSSVGNGVSLPASSRSRSGGGVSAKDKPQPSQSPERVVVAIDFGTAYSGYAYAFASSPDDICMMRRLVGDSVTGQSFSKVPTILLLNGQQLFHSFGTEASDAYHDLDEVESIKWMYFDKFKMELHSRRCLTKEIELEAANGKRMPASHVFAHSLEYFKNCALKELHSLTDAPFEIQWVITVPAIWRHSAKQFMRHAAVQAGLVSTTNPKQLIIALEPEAASIYCRQLQIQQDPTSVTDFQKASRRSLRMRRTRSDFQRQKHSAPEFNKGMRYVVVDCGGGTVDLTVHEVEAEKGRLRELYKATGGSWGSVGIDWQFEALMIEIFGDDFVSHFIRNSPISWLELKNQFESKKRSFSPSKQASTNISLPFSFIEEYKKCTGQSVRDAVKNYRCANIQWSSQGMLRLHPSMMMQLFDPVVSTIVQHIQELLSIPQLHGIQYLFLVGGFSESPVLQEAVHDAFKDQLRVIIPRDVSLTTLKGAVMFGLDPSLIHIRRSAMTYGVGCLHRFLPGKHPFCKRVVKEGIEWCTDIFDIFVYADQGVPHGHFVSRSYTPAHTYLKSTTITLFATEKETVSFVTDPDVKKVGQLFLQMPDITGGKRRELKINFKFGDTEFTAEAVDCTSGKTAQASIDFFNK